MVHIDIYSDPVCPWCYIGKRRLERTLSARDDLKFNIKWHPFLLNPDMPSSGMDQTSYLIHKFGGLERAIKFQDIISETGQGERLALNFDLIQNTPNTINAHRLIRLADNYGLQNEIVEALFSAYFKDGEDIGNQGVLIRIGHRIALNLAKKDFCNDLSKLPQPVVTVLLGGNNAVYQMNKKVAIDIADKLLNISETYEYGLAITTSPRTPTDIVEIINEKLKEKLVNNKAILWKGDGRNPYLGYLAHADFIFATNDSVNMISEAAATGKPVYTIELDGGSKKFTRFHKAMNEAKITRPFKDIIEHWSYQIPNDTIKAASEIKLRTNIKNV